MLRTKVLLKYILTTSPRIRIIIDTTKYAVLTKYPI